MIGLPACRTEIVMLAAGRGYPAGASTFAGPTTSLDRPRRSPELGLRNVAFEVDDLQTSSTGWPRTATGCRQLRVRARLAHGLWCGSQSRLYCPWTSGRLTRQLQIRWAARLRLDLPGPRRVLA